MRRWHILNRLRRFAPRPEADRCILIVEELEAREVLSPVVFTPDVPFLQTSEGAAFTFDYTDAFFVSDQPNGATYAAVLTATSGTISVTTNPNLTVANNGTAAVTVTGLLDDINSLLASGVTFQPTAYYSGDANVALSVTDLVNGGPPGEGAIDLKVEPVASDAAFAVQASGEVWAPSSGFAFSPGFVSVSAWPDGDGSETVTVTFSLDAADPAAFTLSANGVPLTPIEDGLWQVSATDAATLRATLDSLVLTPPAAFNDRAFLSVFADIRDDASFGTDETTATDSHFLGSAYVPVRFFLGGSVTTPAVFGVEGGSIDLGGRFEASDPDEQFGDTHTLTLSVPSGSLTFNPAVVPEGVSVSGDGTTVTVLGTIDGINAFLGTPGVMTYTPGQFFSGVVPLYVTLTNQPGEFFSDGPSDYLPSAPSPPRTASGSAPNAFSGVAALSFVPVADHVFPSATNVTTNQDTPVGLSINTTALADTDGSESVLIVLDGVPAGATLNHGTNLGGGQWALSPADLALLTLTPPAGMTGTFTITAKAIVTDSAPDLGLSDTATESTTFTVTVLPVPATPAPPVLPPAVPPTVPSLPPVVGTALVFGSAPVVTTTSTVTTTTTNTTTETAQQAQARSATFDAYSSGSGTEQLSTTEARVSNAPPTQGSLFAQPEVPLPTYASGERHPLPPVLPLDQTLPVAGFSDSGGDSFALIDKLYRDREAGDRSSTAPAALATQAALATVTVVWTAPTSTLTVTPEPTADAGNQEAAPVAPVAPEGNWPTWFAASVVAGALAAWAWLARGSDGWLTRSVLRLLRTLHRRPSQRTA